MVSSKREGVKRIAIISLGYLWFPCESGTSRFFQIANTFVDAGWEVDCVTTSYQHFKKQPRDNKRIFEQKYPFNIIFIDRTDISRCRSLFLLYFFIFI